MVTPLLSTNTRVQVPLISVQIGEYSFGLYNRKRENMLINGKYYEAIKVTYPNYMESLSVQKINGTVNTYTLSLKYPITEKDDPDLINKILSTISKSRKIILTYGDCATPSFLYRNEEAIITQVSSQIDVASSKISYRISAVSSAYGLQAGVRNFPGYRDTKPSDIIKKLIADKTSGIQDVFYGMHNINSVNQLGLIPGDDKKTTILAQNHMSVLDYLNYLVGCMSSINDTSTSINKTVRYVLTVHDDTSNVLDGPYFKISKVYTEAQAKTSIDYYTIDIGYPNKDLVLNFNVEDDESWAILYDYSQKVSRTDYVYQIGDDGVLSRYYSPALTNSQQFLKMTESDKTWWSQMTQFPITATLTIKGLLRAAILMSYIRVNVYFYGKKHSSSGLYVITKQVDDINSQGYTTTLSLVRVGGADVD